MTTKYKIKIDLIELTKIWEFVPKRSTKTNCIIDNCSENCWSDEARWELRNDFCPEVRTHCIHIIICFPQENRSFIRENQNNILNGIKTHCHSDEE